MSRRLEGKEETDILNFVFSHPKCKHFTEQERGRIRGAFKLAEKIHKRQFRLDGKPYITHIESTLRIYLESGTDSDTKCSPENIIAIILHDGVEDGGDNAISEFIKKGFGGSILLNVLWMTEPSRGVLNQLLDLSQDSKGLQDQIMRTDIWKLYSPFMKGYGIVTDEKVLGLVDSLSISSEMKLRLKEMWIQGYAMRYMETTKPNKQDDVLSEFLGLCLISACPPDIFRGKSSDRRHNLQDVSGLIKKRKFDSARRSRESTYGIYVPRARELGMHTIATNLIFDTNKQRQAVMGTNIVF